MEKVLFLALYFFITLGPALAETRTDLNLLLGKFSAGEVKKSAVLEHVHQNNFPSDVKDVDVVTVENGRKEILWTFSRQKKETGKTGLKALLKKFKEGRVQKAAVMEHVRRTNFPSGVEDVDVVTVKNGKKEILWSFLERNTKKDVPVKRQIVAKKNSKKRIKRQLASVAFSLKEMKKTHPFRIMLDTSLSQIKISGNKSHLDMSFWRVGMGGQYSLSSRYKIQGKLGVNKVFNAKYSGSSEVQNPSGAYTDFGVGLFRQDNAFTWLMSYDYYNYFTTTTTQDFALVDPVKVHQISLRPSYSVTDHFSVFVSGGYMLSSDSKGLSGTDYKVGVTWSIDKKQKYQISGIYDQNNTKSSDASKYRGSGALLQIAFGF